MKRLLTLCSFLLLSLIQVSAQTSYSTDLKKKVAQPKVHAIELTAQPLFFDNHQTAVLSEDCQQLLFGQKPRMADLSLTLEGKTYHLLLERFELFSRDAKMELATGEILDLPTIITYRGKVKSPEDSHVTLCISEDQMTLFVSDEHQQFEVHKDKNSMDLRLVVAPQKERALCHTDDEEDMRENNQDPRNSYADCLELYVECDYSSYLDNGSSTPNTQSWMTNIFSNVATIYNDYNVPIIVSQVFIWNTSDVYTAATGVTSMRTAFVNRLISIGLSGKVGYLLSTKDFAGGISYGIGGFCNPITTYPGPAALTCGMAGSIMNYPYNIQNVSHELGHVLGLRHTHACVWNGVNTQIDDCGNVIAANTGKTPEGSNCFNAASPILPGANGTIMSFCSDLAGQGINLTTGFGPIVGNQLFLNFVNATCFTGTSCSTLGPNNDECVDAIPLTLGQGCNPRTFDNDYGTQSANTPGFACVSQAYSTDVWFSAIVPSSGSLTIETSQVSGGFTDMVIQAYAGSCGALTAIGCDDNTGAGNHALLLLTGRTPGETILIRVTPKDVPATNDYGEFGICAYDASVPCHPDYPALVSFYNSTNGASWTNKTGWINYASNCNVCTWFGVVCTSAGRVSAINLGSNNLSGTIPSAITALTQLTRLNLYSNNFSGTLPNFLDDLPLLEYVDLGNNNFSGAIPSSFGDAPNLRTLYLDNNNFSGTLPAFLVIPPISVLWLNDNNFSGCIPNAYNDFCLRGASLRLELNPLLPGGGNYTDFCLTGYGGDFDNDGFCAGSQDCLDDDNMSYPGAPEICDGKDNDCDSSVDENIPDVTNTWIGTNGNWNVATNWSTGIVPQPCHNVVINPALAYTITITNGTTARASSINLGANVTLLIQNNGNLNLQDKGVLINAGDILCYGNISISNPLNTSGTAFTNSGSLLINSSSMLTITNSGSTAIRNQTAGEITNNGIISILNNHATNGLYGIDNLGMFSNSGQITIENIQGKDIRLASGGMLENSDAGTIDLK